MKTAKTPYEIRSDLLHLAHSIVRDRKHAECTKTAITDGTAVAITMAATAKEVIDEATKLNSFVSQSDNNSHNH